MIHSPWVEKYRPNKFEDIVLEDTNKKLLTNIIKTNNFPNLLFYGPPGTGKTTTIINLINEYQEKYNQKRKGLKIHLNASDDRGIDIIRNQINQFVNTKTLFGPGMKFVILDEVDYMTKNAQQALRYLIQQYSKDIRFCLICNYISRIDISLQNEFVRLRFCQLPKKDIFKFLKKITVEEKIKIKNMQLKAIQEYFKSDIRSMINFIQSNHNTGGLNTYIIEGDFWEDLILKIKNKHNNINQYINEKCIYYNLQLKIFIIKFITYLINKKGICKQAEWLEFIEYIMHNTYVNNNYLLNYTLSYMEEHLHSL
jgi:DNA polymerase III delta prime subunit